MSRGGQAGRAAGPDRSAAGAVTCRTPAHGGGTRPGPPAGRQPHHRDAAAGRRNHAAADLLATLAAAKADLLTRCKNSRRLPVITRHRDGSWLSTIGTLRVRVIDARIAIKTTTGTRTSDYRLITTLLDPATHPHRRTDHALPPEMGDRDRERS